MDYGKNYFMLGMIILMLSIFFILGCFLLYRENTVLNELGSYGIKTFGTTDFEKERVFFIVDTITKESFYADISFTDSLEQSFEVIYSSRDPSIARVNTYWEASFPRIFYLCLCVFSPILVVVAIRKKEFIFKQDGGFWEGG